MSAPQRCEPKDTARDGTHWLSHDIGGDTHLRPFWWDSRTRQWVEVGKSYGDAEMARQGWVYECRIPTPAEITALVDQASDALGELYLLGREHAGLVAALAAFPEKETPHA